MTTCTTLYQNAILPRLRKHQGGLMDEPLLAVESGSRAWGFHSPNSDYDVRLVFTQPVERYLGFEGYVETSEFSDTVRIENAREKSVDVKLDIVGWDVRKFGQLLAKSNCSALEWVFSEHLYVNLSPELSRMAEIAREQFSRRAAIESYLGMARGSVRDMHASSRESATCNLKRLLYGLRALAHAEFILETAKFPPTRAIDLLPQISDEWLAATLRKTIDRKLAGQSESDSVPADWCVRPGQSLSEFLEMRETQLALAAARIPPADNYGLGRGISTLICQAIRRARL
jgi:uncharacterized protein